MTMDPNIKARWVAALRDGRPQTTGVLERVKPNERPYGGGILPAGQCCLGVLCSIAVDEGLIERVDYEGNDQTVQGFKARTFFYGEGGKPEFREEITYTYVETGTLPLEVVQWAGMDEDNPYVRNQDGEKKTLAVLNDQGYSFAQIADFIEEQL